MMDTNWQPILINSSDFKNHDVTPCEKFYYGRYPFRLTFDHTPLVNNRRNLLHFRRQLEDFQYDLLENYCRPYVAHNGVRLYFYNYNDLRVTYNMFKSQITDVAGPINNEHLHLLKSKDYHVKVRSQNWFKKYDCKVYMTVQMFSTGSYYRSSISMGRERYQELIDSQKNFFEANLVDIKKKYGYDDYWSEFYCDYAEFLEILPFLKLQQPDARLIVYKVVLNDKYNKGDTHG